MDDAPAEYFAAQGSLCAPGYNVADHLLDLTHVPLPPRDSLNLTKESGTIVHLAAHESGGALKKLARSKSAATFLTQLEVLAG